MGQLEKWKNKCDEIEIAAFTHSGALPVGCRTSVCLYDLPAANALAGMYQRLMERNFQSVTKKALLRQ